MGNPTSQATLPQLVKGSSIYKLIVPEKVEKKIRYLIRKYPSTEWSGVLFITHQGSFEDNDLIITCQDIYPMDLGSSTWTEFQMSEDVASYMANNIELFDCDTALIHSHHSMGAFFSGQDIKMLQQEGNDTNCFVSLVVDTKGTYVAMITRKVKTESEVTIKNLNKSYEFFGEGIKQISHNDTITKVITKEVIEYFDLDVERHKVFNDLDYLDSRFDEIIQKKNNNKTKSDTNIPWNNGKIKESYQSPLFDYKYENEQLKPSKINVSDGELDKLMDIGFKWTPDPKKIHAAVVHMLTCSLIANPDKIDLKQWVTKHLVNVYKKIFGANSILDTKSNINNAFTEWKDFIIQFTLDYFDYSDVSEQILSNYGMVENYVIKAILDELYEYTNIPYVQEYYDALMGYYNDYTN